MPPVIYSSYKSALSYCHKSFEKVVKSRYYDIDLERYVSCYTLVMKL